MSDYVIYERLEEAGHFSGTGEYSFEYDGDRDDVFGALAAAQDAKDKETGYGGGSTAAQETVPAGPEAKAERAESLLVNLPGVTVEETRDSPAPAGDGGDGGGGGVGEKSWERYRGPLGGTGWRHIHTGEIKYQDMHPAVDDAVSGMPDDTAKRAKRGVDRSTGDEVAEAVARAVPGRDAGELIEAAETSTGDAHPDRIARVAIEDAINKERGSRSGSEHVEAIMEELAGLAPEEPEDPYRLTVDNTPATAKAWVPYVGPDGGTGWEDPESGRVEYTDDPPGEVDLEEAEPSDLAGYLAASLPEDEAVEAIERADGPEDLREEVEGVLGGGGGGRDDIRSVDDVLPRDRIRITTKDPTFGDTVTKEVKVTDITHDDRIVTDGRGAPFSPDDDWVVDVELVERSDRASRDEVAGLLADWMGEGGPMNQSDLDFYWGGMERSGAELPEVPDIGEDTPEDPTREDILDHIDQYPARVPLEYRDDADMFSDHGEDLPDSLDPANADRVEHFEDAYGEGGRSSSSMFIAEGVPDENGDERRLFITNTDPSRADAQGRYDGGERCVAASAGFREAGFETPRYVNVEGDFWAAEELDGKQVTEATWDELADDPVDVHWECVEVFASSMLLGAWDMHGENVFVSDDGFLTPVDLDLAGSETHAEAAAFENPLGGDQTTAWKRFRGLYQELGLEDEVSWEKAVEDTINRVEQMAETGEAMEMTSAATSATDNYDVTSAITENRIKATRGDFFDERSADNAKEVSAW